MGPKLGSSRGALEPEYAEGGAEVGAAKARGPVKRSATPSKRAVF